MKELRLQPVPFWGDYGITVEWLEERAEWIRRDSGSPGMIDGFFDCAGRLMRLCAYDFYLIGPMFFHALIGLEAMLRVHYTATDKDHFKELLERAVSEGLFHDGIYSDIRRFDEGIEGKAGKGAKSHAEKLAALLPALRNEYAHGIYQFHTDYMHLAIQIREMADMLTMPRTPEWKSGRGGGLGGGL